MKFLIILVVVLLLGVSPAALSSPRGIPSPFCGRLVRQGVTLQYCYYSSTQPLKTRDVLYFFHGAGGTPRAWDQSAGALYRRWAGSVFQEGRASPVVFSLSFGPTFQLSDFTTPGTAAYRDILLKEMIPTLERQFGILAPRRLVAGVSMGGMNAAYLWLRAPAGFFAKAAPLCPAITNLNPFAGDKEIDAFLAAHPGLVRQNILTINRFFQQFFPTQGLWDQHKPLSYLLAAGAPRPPRALIVFDTNDDFGFDPGTREFIVRAAQKGIPVEAQPIDSGHCGGVMTDHLADFLVDP